MIRASGPGLIARAAELLPPGLPRPAARRAALAGAWEWAPGAAAPLDLWVFPGPRSATGEDLLEFHLPGSQPLLDALAAALLARGLRRAEPGEFTRRAFLNGRMDLVQAEAVADLVGARSAAGARAAAAVLAGALGREAAAAREALAAALTEIEAGLDFEEGDSQDLRPAEILHHLERARLALEAGRGAEERRGARGGAAFRIALVGAPNAGKSSLFHALTGAEVLVAPAAGTTRDRLEARWPASAAEAPWLLMDGPGRGGPAADARDAAARNRALAEPDLADLTLFCVDLSDPRGFDPDAAPPDADLVVLTKAELPARAAVPAALLARAVAVSAVQGSGRAELEREVARICAAREEQRAARLAAARRHAEAFAAAAAAVARARTWQEQGGAQDLVAEELRAALHALAGLGGALAPEELLGRIFARFCVGK